MNPINPKIVIIDDEKNKDTLKFTISGINVSLANAIRRTILADIPIVCFKTTPYEENKANILINTSRLNNEIIKQRLSCIPININLKNDHDTFPFKQYLLEINVENLSDNIIYITTENFNIIDSSTGKSIGKEHIRQIFPVNDITGNFIDFLRLKPKLSEELLGEKLHLTCKFSIETAKENGMFNAVSNCSYGFSLDMESIDTAVNIKKQELKDIGKDKDEIDFEIKNWYLLDALRITKKDSFDFSIQTACAYSNYELIHKSCDVLISKLDDLNLIIENDTLEINVSENTMSNCFDIILQNEDYTIGKILEYMLYINFYEGNKILTFCGFKKTHPHNEFSIIRVAYKEAIEKSTIKLNMNSCINELIDIYRKIKKSFKL